MPSVPTPHPGRERAPQSASTLDVFFVSALVACGVFALESRFRLPLKAPLYCYFSGSPEPGEEPYPPTWMDFIAAVGVFSILITLVFGVIDFARKCKCCGKPLTRRDNGV